MKTSFWVVTQKPRLGVLRDKAPPTEMEKVAVLGPRIAVNEKARNGWLVSASTKRPPELKMPLSLIWKRAASAMKGVRTASSPSNRRYCRARL